MGSVCGIIRGKPVSAFSLPLITRRFGYFRRFLVGVSAGTIYWVSFSIMLEQVS